MAQGMAQGMAHLWRVAGPLQQLSLNTSLARGHMYPIIEAHVCISVHIYIYIQQEKHLYLSLYIYIYTRVDDAAEVLREALEVAAEERRPSMV